MPPPNTDLRHARERKGWTQAQVAEWVDAAPFTVHRWEAGLSFPSQYYRQRLCDLFGCDAQTLGLVPLVAADTATSVSAPDPSEVGTAGKRSGHLPAGFGLRLAQARQRLQLSQEALAEAVGVASRSVIRWEQETAAPHPYYRERLCALFKTTPQALFGVGRAGQSDLAQLTSLWQVPFPRNHFFTGRDSFLHELHVRFQAERQEAVMQPQILCGLGGIGKTQAALEYAYRFRNDYQAVLWVAAETPETVLADYRALAHLFDLPEQPSNNPAMVRNAVKRWFQQHANWLLIFDNVEDWDLLQAFLPDTSAGHILITTRSQMVGALGIPLDLPTMTQAEGVLFLLRRARLLNQETSLEAVRPALRAQAQTLVDLFDGLPLALDQAGAYMEETRCSLTDYLERYASRRRALLDSRGSGSTQYPASLLATLALAFAQVEHASPEAAEVLRLCAFLHAEAIPEVFLSLAGEALGPTLHALSDDPLRLDRAIKELRRYSLIQRDPEGHLLSLHRLVQAALQEHMGEAERSEWIERIMRALLRIFPSYETVVQEGGGVQVRCQSYLSHALVCAAALQRLNMQSLEAAELLFRIGYHLQQRGDYAQALPYMEQSLQIAMTLLGSDHPTVAFYCNQLALLYVAVKKDRLAEAHYRQAAAIRERVLGPEHPEVAESLWRLGSLLCQQGRFPDAYACAERALTIKERTLGSHHYEVALVLNILGTIALYQGHYSQAEQHLMRATGIYEKTLGSQHLFMASCKLHLADLYARQAVYTPAASLYQHAFQIYEQCLGSDHSLTAITAGALGTILIVQKHYQQAEGLFRKACVIFEKQSSPEPWNQAKSLLQLGALSLMQKHLSRAKRYVHHALVIMEEPIGLTYLDYQDILRCLRLVGERFTTQKERLQAQRCFQEAVTLGEYLLGSKHPLTRECRSRLATMWGGATPPEGNQEGFQEASTHA